MRPGSGVRLAGYEHGAAWDTGFLRVSEIHELYYAQYGKRDGKPVIFLHGGPGGHTSPANTVFFDPAVYRVVLFDQRGAGRSRPPGELRENTSQLLVSDIETLRAHLGVRKWHMAFGGSWGSALGLMYSQAHPEAVGSLVIRGIFTGRKEELEFHRGPSGAAMLFPEAYEDFVSALPEGDRARPFEGYHRLMSQGDGEERRRLARQFNHWDFTTSSVDPGLMDWAQLDDPVYCYAHAALECHYMLNGLFVGEGELLSKERVDRIRHIPGSIVHGRYDVCCLPKTAWDLHKQWPEASLYIIPGAGHSAYEPGTQAKLIEICDEYAKLDLV